MGNESLNSDLPQGWFKTTLGDYLDSNGGSIQTGPFGSQLHASDYVSEGIPSVMPKNIEIEAINENEIARITEEDAERLSKYLLSKGDIIYSRRGDVEKCSLVTDVEDGWLCGTGCLRIRLGSDSKISSEFLHAYLSTPIIREWISRNAIGATMPNLNTSILRDVPLVIPDEYCIRLGADIWNELNQKITLNRQINQTLEQMAQALFQSWFVDFDPVIDNALDAGSPIPEPLQPRAERRRAVRAEAGFTPLPDDVRRLFPDTFVESELGWVPEGWEVGMLSDIAAVLSGFAFKSKDFSELGYGIIKIKNINIDRSVDIDDVQKIPTALAAETKKFLLQDGDLLMAMTGATVGKFGMIVSENKESYFLNQRVAKIISLDEGNVFLYNVLNRTATEDYIVNTAQGSAQPNISAKGILSLPIIVPQKSLRNKFNSLFGTYLKQMILQRKQTLSLIKLRDTLLPKLISGELRLDSPEVKQAQAFVENLAG